MTDAIPSLDVLDDVVPRCDRDLRDLVRAFVDVALVLDDAGIVTLVAARAASSWPPGLGKIVGSRWDDVLVDDGSVGGITRLRVDEIGAVPVRVTTVALPCGRTLVLGTDHRELQQLHDDVCAAYRRTIDEVERLQNAGTTFPMLQATRSEHPAATSEVSSRAAIAIAAPRVEASEPPSADASAESGPFPMDWPRVAEIRRWIGRTPLRTIVRRAAASLEQLCVTVALELTGNNRAAAAQLLGISRQSLYGKLRGDVEPSG
jgi:hypothetical protein